MSEHPVVYVDRLSQPVARQFVQGEREEEVTQVDLGGPVLGSRDRIELRLVFPVDVAHVLGADLQTRSAPLPATDLLIRGLSPTGTVELTWVTRTENDVPGYAGTVEVDLALAKAFAQQLRRAIHIIEADPTGVTSAGRPVSLKEMMESDVDPLGSQGDESP
jgi:hypothetical protein